jgi:hypothetical protein
MTTRNSEKERESEKGKKEGGRVGVMNKRRGSKRSKKRIDDIEDFSLFMHIFLQSSEGIFFGLETLPLPHLLLIWKFFFVNFGRKRKQNVKSFEFVSQIDCVRSLSLLLPFPFFDFSDSKTTT